MISLYMLLCEPKIHNKYLVSRSFLRRNCSEKLVTIPYDKILIIVTTDKTRAPHAGANARL